MHRDVYKYTITYTNTHTHTHRRKHALMGLQKLFAWHDGRMSSRLSNIAPILHWQAYIFFAVPNWLCRAELHLWIIWHISCYFFDSSTQRKFQGTFLLTSRNINIWINCRFGSPHMDAQQYECVYVLARRHVRACVWVSEWKEWEGVCFILLPRSYPLEPTGRNLYAAFH